METFSTVAGFAEDSGALHSRPLQAQGRDSRLGVAALLAGDAEEKMLVLFG